VELHWCFGLMMKEYNFMGVKLLCEFTQE